MDLKESIPEAHHCAWCDDIVSPVFCSDSCQTTYTESSKKNDDEHNHPMVTDDETNSNDLHTQELSSSSDDSTNVIDVTLTSSDEEMSEDEPNPVYCVYCKVEVQQPLFCSKSCKKEHQAFIMSDDDYTPPSKDSDSTLEEEEELKPINDKLS